ncbi:MAG: hypothetical protein DHS20C13_02940 [Thermodesulfobacteriota bacterium]|nr:MAG: hypothetical protein DHS20C13_02940 [Thermodesulfobacteriota bacterium]
MRNKNTKYLSVIFLILISFTSCAPRIITPRVDYQPYEELKESQPNCGGELSALTSAEVKSDQLILDTLFCYRTVWKYWENEYLILDTQLGTINQN